MPSDSVVLSKKAPWIICLGLAFALLAIYGQTTNFAFVNFDDDAYIYANPRVLQGLTVENLFLAFASTQGDLWHPITTLSHLIDVEVFGTWAGGHHLVNVAIHIANAILLFIALRHLTGATIESAIAVGLFALHPLRVESVAWVAERKDVLSGFFFSAMLLSYSMYVRRQSNAKYLALIGVFALGVMSKPTFVTTPFVLLLLDYWPLRRDVDADGSLHSSRRWQNLFVEKLPLFVASAVVCLFTVRAQKVAIQSLEQFPLDDRVLNAGRSYWIYLQQFFWPSDLIAFYAYPHGDSLFFQGIAAWCLMAVITVMVIYFRDSNRFLVVGWLWNIGMLVPVLGLVQAGKQAHADRFTYLPHIGLAIACTWGISVFARKWSIQRKLISSAALFILIGLSVASWRQTRYWQDGIALFNRVLDLGKPSDLIYNNLGIAMSTLGRHEESLEKFRHAIELNPNYTSAMINYGDALRTLGKFEEAIPVLKQAFEREPNNEIVANNLASSLIAIGQYDQAIGLLQSLRIQHPEFSPAVTNMGLAKMRLGRIDEAVVDFQNALTMDTQQPIAYANLGIAYIHRSDFSKGIDAFRKAIELRPDDAETLKNMAWITATDSNAIPETTIEALEWAAKAVQLTGGSNPLFLDVQSAVFAANQKFDEASTSAELALRLALEQGKSGLAEAIRGHLNLYRERRSLR